jgi:hypothetical protein
MDSFFANQPSFDDLLFLLWLNNSRDGAPITFEMAKADTFYEYHRYMFDIHMAGYAK